MDAVLFQIGGGFPQIIANLQNLGFFLFLFPFLLALAIFYGVLSWGAGDRIPKSARGLISIILAFFVMLYASQNVFIVQFFANLSGLGLIVGSGLLFLVILFGILGFKTEELFKQDWAGRGKWVFALAIIVIAIVIFLGAGSQQFGLVPPWMTSSEFLTVIFFIFIIALAMLWLGGGEEKPATGGPTK